MPVRSRHVLWSPITVALLSACAAHAGISGNASTSPASPTTTAPAPIATPLTTQGARTVEWINLQVGDCLSDPPPSDPSVVTVTVVDCATPHHAEVYLRAPVGVNAAIAGVATQKCDAAFSAYTGRPAGDSAFAVTYLIDSSQDRTSSDPAASTVICLLQAANGQALTESARR